MKRIERDDRLEVILAEIEANRAQGDKLGVELFKPDPRRDRIKLAIGTAILGAIGWLAYWYVIWHQVLKTIGAL